MPSFCISGRSGLNLEIESRPFRAFVMLIDHGHTCPPLQLEVAVHLP